MAENKSSFILYSDTLKTLEKVPDEMAGKLFKLILEYVNDQNPVVEDLLLSVLFEPIKQNLKRDLKKWEAVASEKSSSGTLGNLKRWHLDLYKKVITKAITLGDAEKEVELRRKSKKRITPVTSEVKQAIEINAKESSGNFFYIGLEMYKYPVSKYVLNEMQIHTNEIMAQFKPITIEEVIKQMDIIYCGGTFSNHNHVIRAFNKVARELKTPKENKFNQSPKSLKATGNYGKRD